MPWIVNLENNTATNSEGVIIQFSQTKRGIWDGKLIAGLEKLTPENAARIMREAGDFFMEARRQIN